MKPWVYYNEIDPYAAKWLRALVLEGVIAPGEVDTRSVEDVTPNDLDGFTQHHFFAGIGGWSYALRLAGWPDDEPVWTGSCPCQPFSQAGKGEGLADERHLWPSWHWLIRQRRPDIVFGEQVASKDGLAWLDVVQTDLEDANYACGAFDLCAAGVGAPHIRQRLYWVADTDNARSQRRRVDTFAAERGRVQRSSWSGGVALRGDDGKRRWCSTEPGAFPLAHGVSNRVGRIRAYGNAIVPALAAEFIAAYLEG